MCVRLLNWVFLAGLVLFFVAGCKKSTSKEKSGDSSKPSAQKAELPAFETVARVHWLGVKKVLADTNGGSWKKIWALPETARLTSHTLDKLALGVVNAYPPLPSDRTNYLSLSTNYAAIVATNQAALLLRPVLDDLLHEESFLEVRSATNQPGEIAVAIRLDDQRSVLWASNLAAVIELQTGVRPAPAAPDAPGWSCVLSNFNTLVPFRSTALLARNLRFTRAGEWTILEISSGQQKLPSLPGETAKSDATNYWLEVTADPARLGRALSPGWKVLPQLQRLWFGVLGQGEEVLSQGRLTLATPMLSELPAWNIPTNLINDPLHSITAVRGCSQWISALPLWQVLQAGPAPDQFYTWSQSGTPFLAFFAAPAPNASNIVEQLGVGLMQFANSALATNRMGVIERATNFHGFTWNRVPVFTPFLRPENGQEGMFLFGGLAAHVATNTPPPQQTLAELASGTNLVYYDFEITGPRLEAWMHISQLFRLILRRYQLPGATPSFSFLKAVYPVAGPSKTRAVLTSPTELSFERKSTVGLTAVELHALAEWVESPRFPAGTHSLLLKLPPPRWPNRTTNAAPAQPGN